MHVYASAGERRERQSEGGGNPADNVGEAVRRLHGQASRSFTRLGNPLSLQSSAWSENVASTEEPLEPVKQ